MMSQMVTNQSLPNISLSQSREAMEYAVMNGLSVGGAGGAGPPRLDNAAMLGEQELRTRLALQYGLPLNSPLLSTALPYYPIPTGEYM